MSFVAISSTSYVTVSKAMSLGNEVVSLVGILPYHGLISKNQSCNQSINEQILNKSSNDLQRGGKLKQQRDFRSMCDVKDCLQD